MTAPFKCDEKVTIEQDVGTTDPAYGTAVESWVPVLTKYWANVQDVLPSRAESTSNGRGQTVQRSRLRMRGAGGVSGKMRVILHGHGDRMMQIIAGPALLDDRVHYEFQLESYGNQ